MPEERLGLLIASFSSLVNCWFIYIFNKTVSVISEIHIPIQIVGHSSYNGSSQSVLCDEWSDSDSDDLNNSSSTKMRKKRRQRQSSTTLTSSNDSLLNGAVSKSEEDIEYDLKRKVGICQRLDHSDKRYNTRSSSVSAKNDETILIKSDSDEQEINDTCSYSVYKYLKAFLASSGRQIDSIKGDGNCFFRALSKIIYGNQSYYDDIRQAVVDVEEKYPKKFEAFADGPIDRHIQDMRLDKTWATQTEIYAAATLLNRDFYILSPDQTGENYRWLLFQPQAQYNKNFTGCKCYVTICHTHGNHYDRIAPRHGQCNCDLDPPHLTGVKGQVDLTEEDEIV